jgi:tRNA A-37 threonylcarbamoyl transferase component Bud32
MQGAEPITPLADVPEIQRGDWFDVPADDPVVAHLRANYWGPPAVTQLAAPSCWEAARLSHAAFVYREPSTRWSVVAKFYTVKSSQPERYAGKERDYIRQAQAAGLGDGRLRTIQPLGLWRGVLFLEYVDGLTLEDTIAVRRSRPGTLVLGLEKTARLLATLHTHGTRPASTPEFGPAAAYAHEVVSDLTHGVLEGDPVVRDGLDRLIDRWAADAAMEDFTPTWNHGDATTSNFVFPWEGGIVAIDWERFEVSDPAADLGRLMAEVSHSIKQHGGSVAESKPFVQRLVNAYCEAMPTHWDCEALLRRAKFYQAQSTLRIARNGWVSRLDRTSLVAQAAILLATA